MPRPAGDVGLGGPSRQVPPGSRQGTFEAALPPHPLCSCPGPGPRGGARCGCRAEGCPYQWEVGHGCPLGIIAGPVTSALVAPPRKPAPSGPALRWNCRDSLESSAYCLSSKLCMCPSLFLPLVNPYLVFWPVQLPLPPRSLPLSSPFLLQGD